MTDVAGTPPGPNEPVHGNTVIKAFLIADVRGYTLFTQERGDEAAGKLAARFARVAREIIEGRGGTLLELRGDEALAVFDSPRQAIRTGVDLQNRFVQETEDEPDLPLPVGIGVDAGEAVPVEGGYRGGALNLAARLCGMADPGEVLISQELAHLARLVEGTHYVDHGEFRLKGLADPVRVLRVVPDGVPDPVERLTPYRRKPAPEPPRRVWWRRHPVTVVVGALVLALVAVGVPFALGRHGTIQSLGSIPGNGIGIIDPATARIVSVVPGLDRPGAITVGFGSVWVTNPDIGKVVRIDPAKGVIVQSIPVGQEPTGIVAGNGAIWVAQSAGRTLAKIDPGTNTVVQSIVVGNGPVAVAFDPAGSVWVANRLDDTVSRVDALTGNLMATIPVGGAPTGLAVGDGSLWVTNAADATVSRIDLKTASVTGSIHTGNGPRAVAVDAGGAWVANDLDGTVSRIGADSNSVTSTTRVGTGPAGISLTAGSVWVVDRYSRSVTQIGATSGTITHTVALGNAPQAIALVEGRLWVAVSNASSAHRGGTLTVVSDGGPDSIDPAVAYSGESWQMLWMTNDGLVGFERTGGAEGATLVPDLATSLPTPTDGGRTYTFQLRRGIKYSNGRPVRASDVPATIRRVFRGSSPGAAYYEDIVGGDGCVKAPGLCSLSSGIVTDETAGTVIFHLRTPDPEFLTKLALPFAFLLPQGTPDAAPLGKEKPLPATGPYQISSYVVKRNIELTRNPNFKEWAPAAQPDGYPDRIAWRFDVPAERSVDLIEHGQADWQFSTVPPDRLGELQTRFAGQIHPYTQATMFYMALNTRLAPFNDVRVRRALNFAVDRGRVAQLLGGTTQAQVTCQILPPNFPGYRPYCPYTLHPNASGTWSAPDLAQARRLIQAAGVAGARVVVWSTSDPSVPFISRLGPYFVGLLKSLGFRSSLDSVPDATTYFNKLFDTAVPIQIGASGWLADYLTASGFIEQQLSCQALVPHSHQNGNAARFCDPAIDARAREAGKIEQTDPAAAAQAWAGIDRAITDVAPYVSFANPVGIDLVSHQVGNYQRHPQWGLLLDQLWVR